MAVCTYFGQDDCTPPDFGGGSPATSSGSTIHHLLNEIINGPAHYTQSHHLSNGPTLIIVLGALLAEFVGAYVIFMAMVKTVQYARPFMGLLLRHFGVVKPDTSRVFLELTFPAGVGKSAFATEQLHILRIPRSGYDGLKARIATHKHRNSLEVYATRDSGVRFVAVVPESEVLSTEENLRSYMPGIKIKQVPDYLDQLKGSMSGVIELRLAKDYALPLKDHKALEEHDFVAFLVGHMTKLAQEELIAYQIVDVPVSKHSHTRITRHMRHLHDRIALSKTVSDQLAEQRSLRSNCIRAPFNALNWYLSSMYKIVKVIWQLIVSMFAKDHPMPDYLDSAKRQTEPVNPYELERTEAIKSKLGQPLFEVSIRVLVAAEDEQEIGRRLNAILASFKPFKSTYNQEFITHTGMSIFDRHDHQYERFLARTISPHWPDQQTVLSASELADLYHFPNTDLSKTEDLVKSRSPDLPAPLSIKRSNADLDVIVGVNEHGGDNQAIGMTLGQRQKHAYIIGKTGTGKSTLLLQSIYQDMVNGKGLAVLDPHGDMFQELLGIIPKHRRKDVVVFNPKDEAYYIGLNLLDPGIVFGSEKEKQQFITSNVVEVFKKLADKRQWGSRMEHILRTTTLTALQLPNPSLYTLQRLLTEKKYQRQVAATLKDPVLRQFWQKEFALLGTRQLATAVAPLTNRLGQFITTIMTRHILLQEKSTVSISDIMNDGKILLVNLSKGDIGEDESIFFGTIITSFIWMAAYQRTKIPEKDRRDFFLYVDEFQNFATRDFSNIASEGRKYHIPLIVSHQNTAQIEDKAILNTVFGNADTIICFKASPDDEAFILPTMRPEVSKGNIVDLPPHHFFMKTTAGESEDAFSGHTVPLEVKGSDQTKDAVIAYSQKKYGTPVKKVEAYLEKLFGEDSKHKRKPKNNDDTSDDNDSGNLFEG
jgi:hypothetical protein